MVETSNSRIVVVNEKPKGTGQIIELLGKRQSAPHKSSEPLPEGVIERVPSGYNVVRPPTIIDDVMMLAGQDSEVGIPGVDVATVHCR